MMTGDLPDDFLRMSGGSNQGSYPYTRPMVPVQQLYYPQGAFVPYKAQPSGRLSITVQQVGDIDPLTTRGTLFYYTGVTLSRCLWVIDQNYGSYSLPELLLISMG